MVKKKQKITKTGSRKFNDDLVFDAYELAYNGLSLTAIADAFKTDLRRVRRWRERYPIFKLAVERGKARRKIGMSDDTHKPTESIEQYVNARLSPALQPTWKQLMAFDKEENPQKKIDALFRDKGTVVRQQLFLHALVTKSFKVAPALRICGLSYNQLQTWRNDPAFAAMVDEIQFHKANFVKDKLMAAVQRGDQWAVTLALKAFAKDEFADHTVIEHKGTVQHKHETFPVEKLSLPLRKAVLAEFDALAKSGEIPDADYSVKALPPHPIH